MSERPVALTDQGLQRVVKETTMALQIAQAGNIRSAALTIKLAEATDQFDRVLISSDAPTGTGMMPLGVFKSLTEMATLTDVESERIIATATGNCTRVYDLDAGLLKPGMVAVFSNGIPRFVGKSRNTPLPTRHLRIAKNQIVQQFREIDVHHCC